MPADPPDPEVAQELDEQQEAKDDEVLQREGLEKELMQEDASEVGEGIEDAEE